MMAFYSSAAYTAAAYKSEQCGTTQSVMSYDHRRDAFADRMVQSAAANGGALHTTMTTTWNSPAMLNSRINNKQVAENNNNNNSRALQLYYNELPREVSAASPGQDQTYNWYHTMPLTHDGYPQDFVYTKENIQETFNRKGRILNERQKRYRTSFTTFQLGRLEEEFQKDMYAVGMKRMRLAGELNLTEKQVKVWFQNRRMKYKRVCQRLHNRRMAVNKLWTGE